MSTKDNIEQLELHLKYVFEHNVNFKERIILLNQEIDDHAFSLVESAMTEMESYNRQPITIRICSEGGSVSSALAIVGRMKKSKCKIITEGYGCIQSAATLILAAGKQRSISRFTSFMHHEASYEAEGRHSAIKATVAEEERQEQLWAQWMAEFSNMPKEFYLKHGVHVDAFWTVEKVLEYGIVDSII